MSKKHNYSMWHGTEDVDLALRRVVLEILEELPTRSERLDRRLAELKIADRTRELCAFVYELEDYDEKKTYLPYREMIQVYDNLLRGLPAFLDSSHDRTELLDYLTESDIKTLRAILTTDGVLVKDKTRGTLDYRKFYDTLNKLLHFVVVIKAPSDAVHVHERIDKDSEFTYQHIVEGTRKRYYTKDALDSGVWIEKILDLDYKDSTEIALEIENNSSDMNVSLTRHYEKGTDTKPSDVNILIPPSSTGNIKFGDLFRRSWNIKAVPVPNEEE